MRILYNARITTLDPARPQAEAVAINRDRIIAVGSSEEILALAARGVEKTDLQGQTIWPGLVDAHIHLQHYALGLQMVDCETGTREECLRRVAERARQLPPGAWVRGHGWNQNNWPEGFGSREDLDQAAPNHPVYLTAKSLHASWANSRALELAGINANTPDPQDGSIGRRPSGQPDGILFEAAMNLMEAALPEPGPGEVRQAILEAQANLWALGITGAHDYDPLECFAALQMLHQEGRLRLRVLKGIPAERLPDFLALGLRTGFGDAALRIGSLKLFSDGALGPHTAAMLEPYQNDPHAAGMLFMTAEDLLDWGRNAVSHGVSLAVHAIGDRANRQVLDAYQQLRRYEQEQGLPALRHRIEHVQLLHPADLPRLAQLDVIASVQPIHATSDMYMAERYWGERSAGAYAYASLLASGARLAFGSDAPVESPNPFLGLHAAVTRRRINGEPQAEGWHPEQRLSLQSALHAFTTGPAYAAGLEDCLGKLSPGYLADLIVLDADPFTLDPHQISSLRPKSTMIAGEWVYSV